MKRTFDLFASILGILFLFPFVPVLIFLVRIESPGPGIFVQYRVGRHEKPFRFYKLRTMKIETDSAPSHEIEPTSLTNLGVFLRKFKIDELPQLVNVIKGEMSLVGPRPCLPIQTEIIEARREMGLYDIKPGMTGISQIAGIDMSKVKELTQADSIYLREQSLVLDLKLILQTVVGAGRGDSVSK